MRKSLPIRFGSLRARPPLCFPGQRIGLLGGSFNPPHDGHALITKIALARLRLDSVWWLVTPGNPLKSLADLPPLEDRIAACRHFIGDNRVSVTGFEEGLPTSFTAATLAYLKARHAGTRFVWIIGADNLAGFHHWHMWREIFEMFPIAVIDRPDWHLRALANRASGAYARSRIPEYRAGLLPLRKAPAWTFLTGPLSPLSSTKLRKGHIS